MAASSGPFPPFATPPAFPPPNLLPARCIAGAVHVPGSDHSTTSGQDAVPPTSLIRQDSCAGNILLVEGGDTPRAYWIQRKISNTTHGSVRVGFILEPSKESNGNFDWQLVPSNSSYPYEMAAIKMLDKSKVVESKELSSSHFVKDATVELSALQMVADAEWQDRRHVVGCREILSDESRLYVIMPYHGDGTLFQYVEEMGRLDEGVARHFFRQILKGLSALQRLGLCHRNLSLDHVLLQGTDCSLIHLGSAVRIPKDSNGTPLLLDPNGACCGHPQYISPELLRGDPYNGYAIDLWAAGVMLFAMLFGNSAPFVWAAPDDRKFRAICVKGNLDAIVQLLYDESRPLYSKKKKWSHLSDQAIDLLQSMLRADARRRLSLQQVMNHPWVVASGESDVVPPSISETIKNINMGRNQV